MVNHRHFVVTAQLFHLRFIHNILIKFTLIQLLFSALTSPSKIYLKLQNYIIFLQTIYFLISLWKKQKAFTFTFTFAFGFADFCYYGAMP